MTSNDGPPTAALLDRGGIRVPRSVRGSARDVLERIRRQGLRQWITRERDAFVQTAKSALACVLAWVVAKQVFHSTEPVLAPAAALIVMQVTVYQSITRSLQYSLGVTFGVGVALGMGHFYNFTWYTLLVIVVGSLVIGRTLRGSAARSTRSRRPACSC